MTEAYPLQWPEGWPRTRSRRPAHFGKTETKGTSDGHSWKSKSDITMVEALKRVRYELDRLGVNIEDDMIVSTNLRLNMQGLPRGDQGEPSDPGAAVYFQKKNGPMRVIAIDAVLWRKRHKTNETATLTYPARSGGRAMTRSKGFG